MLTETALYFVFNKEWFSLESGSLKEKGFLYAHFRYNVGPKGSHPNKPPSTVPIVFSNRII
jgi:hypothetical protein